MSITSKDINVVDLFNRIRNSKKRLISIEGGISVGKSTLGRDLNMLLNTFNIVSKFYTEPFNQRMLEQFLSDMKKYAYTFQMYMLTRRQLDYNEAYRERDATISILDRSMTGDYVFMSLQKKYGNVSDEEFAIYQEEYDKFTKYKPDIVLFLNVDIETMKTRIAKRNRNGETKYNFEYLDELQKQYMDILPTHIPSEKTIIIDWNNDVLDNTGHVREDILIALLQQMF